MPRSCCQAPSAPAGSSPKRWPCGGRIRTGPDFQRQASRLVYDDADSPLRIIAGDLLVVPRCSRMRRTPAGWRSSAPTSCSSRCGSCARAGGRASSSPCPRRSTSSSTAAAPAASASSPAITTCATSLSRREAMTFASSSTRARGRARCCTTASSTTLRSSQKGLDEFAFYAGVKSDLGPNGPEYSNDWLVSGFYRRGLTDSLTAGVHFQADAQTAMGGFEGLWSNQIGLFGGDFAVSRADGFGMGWAGSLTFERMFSGAGTFDLQVRERARGTSRRSARCRRAIPSRGKQAARISHTFSDSFYAGADVSYSKGRGDLPNRAFYRANAGFQLTASPRARDQWRL